MGLSMLLLKKTIVEGCKVTITKNGKPLYAVKPERNGFVVETIAAWWNFYPLHEWFIKHCNDESYGKASYHINPYLLPELLEILNEVKQILERSEDLSETEKQVEKIFPSGYREAFNYDIYKENVEVAIETVEQMISDTKNADPDVRWEFIYEA
jgi:AAA15 family ATPase/GTPase